MPPKLQIKYQYTYDRGEYNGWLVEMPFPKAYEIFTCCGHQYMIKPFEMCFRYSLFIHSTMVVTLGFERAIDAILWASLHSINLEVISKIYV